MIETMDRKQLLIGLLKNIGRARQIVGQLGGDKDWMGQSKVEDVWDASLFDLSKGVEIELDNLETDELSEDIHGIIERLDLRVSIADVQDGERVYVLKSREPSDFRRELGSDASFRSKYEFYGSTVRVGAYWIQIVRESPKDEQAR
jgi:hypothetical protein